MHKLDWLRNPVQKSKKSAQVLALALGVSAGLGCSPAATTETPITPVMPQGPCGALTATAPDEVGAHFPQGTDLNWQTNPPAAGPHYPVWAPWAQAFTETVPRGNWMHNAEHGGVILLYRCPAGCPEVAAQLQQIGAALPQDPACAAPINARWLVTPDPLLPDGTQIAAVTWGYYYRASCLDPDSLRAFISAHYARAPEDFCGQGAIGW